jgi:hypothetical protein
MSQWLLIPALIGVALLVWRLFAMLKGDVLQRLNESRRSTSRLVSRGELVDGSRHVDVAMALSDSALYYENADMQASLDLKWIEEIDYDNELATGQAVSRGKVMRLRCFSTVFEFILPEASVQQWELHLPPLRQGA